MSKPARDGADVAQVPAREDDDVGHFPVELLDDLERQRLLALEPQAVHRVGEVDRAFGGEALHDRHAAVEVGVEREHERAVGERLHQLRRRHARPRQDDDGRNPRRRRVGGERRRRVTGRGARDGADAAAVGDHLLDDRDEHRHAEILERPGVRVAAHLDPEILDPDRPAVALGPEDVGAALVHRDDVLVADLGTDPLLLAPDARAVRPRGALVAIVEEAHPRDRAAVPQGLDVVRDLQQLPAGGAVVDRLPDGMLAVAPGNAAKDGAVAGHVRTCPTRASRDLTPLRSRGSLALLARAVLQPSGSAVAGTASLASKSARLRPIRTGSTPWPVSTSIVL